MVDVGAVEEGNVVEGVEGNVGEERVGHASYGRLVVVQSKTAAKATTTKGFHHKGFSGSLVFPMVQFMLVFIKS